MKSLQGYIVAIVATAMGALMVVVVMLSGGGQPPTSDDEKPGELSTMAVSILQAQFEDDIEITDSYSGMIRPWERFTLGFEVPGRVAALGVNAQGKSLDDGDQIAKDSLLARLDDRVHQAKLNDAKAQEKIVLAQLASAQAQHDEATARREKAESDMRRVQELRDKRVGAISDEKYQESVTAMAVTAAGLRRAVAQQNLVAAQSEQAEALVAMAEKNLADTKLLSPVDGVISRRLINAGETVSSHQQVMEIVQLDQVLLVVGVPEAYVAQIHPGQVAHVELLARDRFRQQRPEVQGHVLRVAETSDQTTGLFEVEIAIANEGRTWKPGLIALAHIVLKEVSGVRVPIECAIFRDDKAFLFLVDKNRKARRFELTDWIEQDSDLIVQLPSHSSQIVSRGQHRLVEGRPIEIHQLAAGRSTKKPPDSANTKSVAKSPGGKPTKPGS